ncbi:hypothetical protein Tco_0280819 [Tanacetum coccineum]
MNPTIYTSCIKQFWATAKAKTVNGEVQIQALVDRKKVIVIETSVRRALQLKDAEGTECLSNATIFEQLTLMGRKQRKDTEVPQPSGSTEPITNEAANEEHVPTHSNDLLLSGEDKLQLKELLELCTKLSERVLDLENNKTLWAARRLNYRKVKNTRKENKSRTSWLKRLRKVGRTARIESSEDEVFDEQEVKVEKVVSTAEVTTVSATTTTVDELTLAQTLIEIKAAKPKLLQLLLQQLQLLL